MKRKHSRVQRGYNLVEVLVAVALLGVVMLAIASLFVWGRKNVYSGKQMTAAIAVGTRVLEDLGPLTKQDIYNGVFDIADTATGATSLTFGNPPRKYLNVAIRSTNPKLVTGYSDIQKQKSTGPKLLDKWTDQLYEDPTTKLRPRLLDGTVTLIMMPRSDTVSPERFSTSAVMQMRVVVSWSENRRRREVVLDSVKAN